MAQAFYLHNLLCLSFVGGSLSPPPLEVFLHFWKSSFIRYSVFFCKKFTTHSYKKSRLYEKRISYLQEYQQGFLVSFALLLLKEEIIKSINNQSTKRILVIFRFKCFFKNFFFGGGVAVIFVCSASTTFFSVPGVSNN